MSELTLTYLTDVEVEEVASFLGIGFDECKEKIINYIPKEIAKNWLKLNPCSDAETRNFYSSNELYLFELTRANASLERMNFHGKVLEALFTFFPPQHYSKMLDFGAGVGSDILKFLEKGYDASFADIQGKTTEFVKYRLKRRNLEAKFIPIEGSPIEFEEKYSIIICFDVLEHVWDPIATLRSLVAQLTENGVIAIINCPNDEDGDHPCHLPHTFSTLGVFWLPWLDNIGLVGVRGQTKIYRKASLMKKILKKIRFALWRKTGFYFSLSEGLLK